MKNLSNYTLRALLLGVLLQFSTSYLKAQTVTKNTAVVVQGAVCPVAETEYSVSFPTTFSSCTRTWSAINGTIVGSTTGTTVKVKWNDTPGAKGRITCTFNNCANSDFNNVAPFLEELILSVKNQAWGSYGSSVAIDYCTKAQVSIVVPSMVVQGTDGENPVSRTEVAYAWTLPGGWREAGTHRTGNFGTATNYVTIEPIDCAKPGNVTVFGTLVGAGPFCNLSEKSATATIALNGANPVVTVGPQVGYTGGSACKTTEVTFYATTSVALGCITSYNWSYPPSWSFVSQNTNSITLRPSGTQSDSNPINATIGFSCGSTVTSANYVPPFAAPTILGRDLLCSGASYSVQNATGVSVTWSSSNTSIAYQPNRLYKNYFERNGNANGAVEIRAKLPCAATVPPKTIWVGLPVAGTITANTSMCPGYGQTVSATVLGSPTSQDWSISSGNGANAYFTNYGNGTAYFNSYVVDCYGLTLTMQNSCGTSLAGTTICVDNCSSASAYNVYPNPAKENLMIEFDSSRSADLMPTEITLYSDKTQEPVYRMDHSQILAATSKEGVLTIPVSEMPSGAYYLHITSGQNSKQKIDKIKILHE